MAKKTERAKYLVKEKGWNVSSRHADNPWIWFQLMTESGSLRQKVRIPLHHETYTEKQADTLSDLSSGDIVEAILTREAEGKPWVPAEIEKIAESQ